MGCVRTQSQTDEYADIIRRVKMSQGYYKDAVRVLFRFGDHFPQAAHSAGLREVSVSNAAGGASTSARAPRSTTLRSRPMWYCSSCAGDFATN